MTAQTIQRPIHRPLRCRLVGAAAATAFGDRSSGSTALAIAPVATRRLCITGVFVSGTKPSVGPRLKNWKSF